MYPVVKNHIVLPDKTGQLKIALNKNIYIMFHAKNGMIIVSSLRLKNTDFGGGLIVGFSFLPRRYPEIIKNIGTEQQTSTDMPIDHHSLDPNLK